MSKESIQFVEMARQAAAAQKARKAINQPYSFFCPGCLHQRFFEFSHDSGNKEYYRCTSCGRLIEFTVR